MDPVERDLSEGRGPPRLEATRQVPRAQAEDGPREDAAAARDDPAGERPVHDPAARRVARADDDVGGALHDRRDQVGQDGRVVAEVGVHLDDDLGAALERAGEAVEIGAAEARLHRAVADPDARVRRRHLVGQPARAVRRPVVDDEQGRAREGLEDGGGDRADVLGFLVRGEDDPGARSPAGRSPTIAPARGWGGVVMAGKCTSRRSTRPDGHDPGDRGRADPAGRGDHEPIGPGAAHAPAAVLPSQARACVPLRRGAVRPDGPDQRVPW